MFKPCYWTLQLVREKPHLDQILVLDNIQTKSSSIKMDLLRGEVQTILRERDKIPPKGIFRYNWKGHKTTDY